MEGRNATVPLRQHLRDTELIRAVLPPSTMQTAPLSWSPPTTVSPSS